MPGPAFEALQRACGDAVTERGHFIITFPPLDELGYDDRGHSGGGDGGGVGLIEYQPRGQAPKPKSSRSVELRDALIALGAPPNELTAKPGMKPEKLEITRIGATAVMNALNELPAGHFIPLTGAREVDPGHSLRILNRLSNQVGATWVVEEVQGEQCYTTDAPHAKAQAMLSFLMKGPSGRARLIESAGAERLTAENGRPTIPVADLPDSRADVLDTTLSPHGMKRAVDK